MNDFLGDLFKAACQTNIDLLQDYEDEDVSNFFESATEEPKERMLKLA